jgi:uncharacterized protein YcbX
MRIDALWRYPVKSMGGERVDGYDIGPSGIDGDRRYAVVDRADGRVASAKHPRKWGSLLEFAAAYVDGPAAPPLLIFPAGERIPADDPAIDARISKAIGREVTLAEVAPEAATYEAEWPDIEGVIPDDFLAATRVASAGEGERLTALPPRQGSFLDVAAVHLLAASTLDHLGALAPGSVFDVRRFRPNVVVGGAEGGFVENGWLGSPLHAGAVVLQPLIATMRCVMTTLGQCELPRDPAALRTIAAHNRIEIPGFGTWSCVGLYAEVATAGHLRVGDPFEIG